MPSIVAVLDACVLFPATMRDVLMQLAAHGLFEAKWSAQIHAEWMKAIREARPDIPVADVEAIRAAMDDSVPQAMVFEYEDLVSGLSLPDPGDRHVLAAAMRAGASVIVTLNLRHFPEAVLAPLGVRAQHPDLFLKSVLAAAPDLVVDALAEMRQRWKRPPFASERFLDVLRDRGLPETAAALRPFIRRL